MTDLPLAFEWLNLQQLSKNPNGFPNEEIFQNFPLFPLLTAASLVILLDQKDIFNQVTANSAPAAKGKSQKKSKDALLMKSPSLVLEILLDGEKLIGWIKAVRAILLVDDTEPEHSQKSENTHAGYHRPKKKVFLNCSRLYENRHPDTYDEECRPLVSPYGLDSRHLVALGVLEQLDRLYKAYNAKQDELAQQEFHDGIGTLLIYSDRSFYRKLGWLPPEADYHPTKTLLQQVHEVYPNSARSIPLQIQRVISEVRSRREMPASARRSLPLRQDWERSERIRLLSKRDDLIYFISGITKSLFKFQTLFDQLSGVVENRKSTQAFRAHVRDIALPFMRESPNLPWSTFYKASEEIWPKLIKPLKDNPFPPEAGIGGGDKKKQKVSITTKTLIDIFSEMAPGHPEFFKQKIISKQE